MFVHPPHSSRRIEKKNHGEVAISRSPSPYLSRHLFTEKKTEVTPVAIGVTGAIATNRLLRGGNRVHICVISPNYVRFEKLDLPSLEGSSGRLFHDQLLHEKICSMVEVCTSKEYIEANREKIVEQEHVLKILLKKSHI